MPKDVLREWEARDRSLEPIEWERDLSFLREHQRDLAHLPPDERPDDPTKELWIPPFDACDRTTDMRQAYQHFQRLVEEGGGAH